MNGENSTNVTMEERKLFVGGLGWDTTEKHVLDYFSNFGEIESISLKMNPNTGRSRGFAFIVFKNTESTNQVLSKSDHLINNRLADCKRAIARTGKIFVGGLRSEISNEDVRAHFSQFGRVVEMEVPFDKQRNQRKGFCFITFEQEQVANDLLKNPQQTINDYQVDLRRAQPKMEYSPYGFPPPEMFGAGRGGAIRGRGKPTGPYGYNSGYEGGYGGGYNSSGYGGYGYDYNNGYGGYSDYQGYQEASSYPKGRSQYVPRQY